jgi:hypothetical protein
MKMNSHGKRAVCLLALFVSLSCSKRNRELSEALEWIDNTYNPHEGWSRGHGRTGWYASDKSLQTGEYLVWGSTETFRHNGCQMTLHVEDNPYASAHSEVYGTHEYTFNLCDINPRSVKLTTYSHLGGFPCEGYKPEELERTNMNCDHAEITFSTRTEAPLIDVETHATFPKLQGKDHTSSGKSKDTGAFFEVDDVEYATRLTNAFRRAVELCGGKASAF